MSLLRRGNRNTQASAHEHVADSPVGGGGHELMGSRDRDRAHVHRVRHLGRFRWVTAALFVIAVAALAAAVVLSGNSTRTVGGGSAWSSWHPPDDGLAGAQEIADYIAPYYRASAAEQLAVVTVVNLNNPAAPVQVVVPGTTSGSLLPLPAGSTVVYNLCGVGGSNCSIGTGKPSAARLLLLKREALELSLYTFKYISGAQTVVAILPPGHTEQAGCTGICAKPQSKPVVTPVTLAVAFDRPELQPYLAQPLRSTLPEEIPPTVAAMPKASEAALVSVIAGRGLFSEKTQSGQDGSTVVTMSPMAPQ